MTPMPIKRLAFVNRGVAFRRLENPPVGGQAVGGRDTLRVLLVAGSEADNIPSSINAPPDSVRVFAIVAVW